MTTLTLLFVVSSEVLLEADIGIILLLEVLRSAVLSQPEMVFLWRAKVKNEPRGEKLAHQTLTISSVRHLHSSQALG